MFRRPAQMLVLGCLIACTSGCLLDRSGSLGTDANPPLDGEVDPDASVRDAGPRPDAGPMADAGPTPDARPPTDAGPSDAGPALEVPGAPGSPTFSGVTTTSQTVTWTAPTTGGPVATYEVQRALNAAGVTALVDVGTTPTPAFDDSSLSPSTAYIYRVRGVNAAGAGPYSVTSIASTLGFGPFTRVQFSETAESDPDEPWTAPPAAGNLLVAVAFHRTDASSPSIMGWDVRVSAPHASGDDSNRRQLAVLTRVATASEAAQVSLDWSPDRYSQLIIQEFRSGAGGWEFFGAADSNTGSNTRRTLDVSIEAPAGEYAVIGAFGSRDSSNDVLFDGLGGAIGVASSVSAASGFGLVNHGGGTFTQTVNWGSNRRASAAILLFRRVP